MTNQEIVAEIARIYAKNDGLDPDADHLDSQIKILKDQKDNIVGSEPILVATGKKNWEIYTQRAQSAIEIFKILKEKLK